MPYLLQPKKDVYRSGALPPAVRGDIHVQNGVHGRVGGGGDLGLESSQVGWIGLRFERRHGDPALALLADPDQSIGRQTGALPHS